MGVPLRPATDDDHSLNHSANLYSMMIAFEYFNTDLVISPDEVNPFIRQKIDYNYDAFRPEDGFFWDDTFVARIDDPVIGSNASYAHLAICGDRQRLHWRDTQDPNMPIIGTRGTRDGISSGPEYHRSPTLRLHGSPRRWIGHIVLADNHVTRIERFTRRGTIFDDGTGSKQDNMYAAEFSHSRGNHAAADAFLGIFTEASEWAVKPVYDPLDE